MIDQAEIHRMVRSENVDERRKAANQFFYNFTVLQDKEQAWNDLIQLTQDKDFRVRKLVANALGVVYSQIPEENKEQAWADLHRLMQDKDFRVRKLVANAFGAVYSNIPKEHKHQAWNDLHCLTQDNDEDVRTGAADALSVVYSQIPEENKEQAWNDLHRLTQDNNDVVRKLAAFALSVIYSQIPDEHKQQAWIDLIRLTQDKNGYARWCAADALGEVYSHIPEEHRLRAWQDLIRLTQDNDEGVRKGVADALGEVYSHIPDKHKQQAWKDIIRLTHDKDDYVQWCAADALGEVYSHIPDKYRQQAWIDLIRLTKYETNYVRKGAAYALSTAFSYIQDEHKQQAWIDLIYLTQNNDDNLRRGAANALGVAYFHMPDKYKQQAWIDLHQLTVDKNDVVRKGVANAIGAAYSHILDKYKQQAWIDLILLTKDIYGSVRASAYHSLGKASIFNAAGAENKEDLKKYLEEAILYFEKSSQQMIYFNPAAFCLPFYRSFYMLTFKKEEAEAEVQKYLAEAKSAVYGSESKEKLLEAVENLGNALKEVQNIQDKDFNAVIFDLNAYRRYCERASELLEITGEKAPGATWLIKKGLPIIDERIKGIIGEIQGHAKKIYAQTKYTPLKDFAQKTCKQTQELSLQNPLDLEIGLGRIINTAKEWCEYIKHEDKKKSICEKLQSLENLGIQEKVIVFSEIFQYISTNLTIPHIQTVHICDTQNETVRIAVIQICYELTKSFPPIIENRDVVKAKIFSGLDIAKKECSNIACLPELCLFEEWIPEIEKNYPDLIVIGGGFYKNNKNICPVITKSDIEIFPQLKITPAAPEDPEMWENGMTSGDRIYKYETQFGKFIILICRDFERFAHYFIESDIDFIFCPAFNEANDRFHVEANSHVTKTPSYILMANTGTFGGSSIFAQLNKNHFYRLVGEGCKDDGDMSFKLCEVKKGKDEVIIADFNLTHKSIQVPAPSEPSKEKRSVAHIKKLPIP